MCSVRCRHGSTTLSAIYETPMIGRPTVQPRPRNDAVRGQMLADSDAGLSGARSHHRPLHLAGGRPPRGRTRDDRRPGAVGRGLRPGRGGTPRRGQARRHRQPDQPGDGDDPPQGCLSQPAKPALAESIRESAPAPRDPRGGSGPADGRSPARPPHSTSSRSSDGSSGSPRRVHLHALLSQSSITASWPAISTVSPGPCVRTARASGET